MITEKVFVGDVLSAGDMEYEVVAVRPPLSGENTDTVDVYVIHYGTRDRLFRDNPVRVFHKIVRKAFRSWKDEMSKEE
jgi:hypothetical protein